VRLSVPAPRLPLVADPLRRARIPDELGPVTTHAPEADALDAGMSPVAVERIWHAVERLYRSGADPDPAAPAGETPPPLLWSEGARAIGGLLAISLGVLLVAAIAVVAMVLARQSPNDVASIAAASFGVIGSIVGAYFGVKIGNDRSRDAQTGERAEAAKAQAFALHVPEDKVAEAQGDARRLTREAAPPGSRRPS